MIRCAEHHWGREWNAGDNLNCGTGEGLLSGYILLSLFLRTVSNITARIPLPSSKPPVPVVFESTFSPGEGLRLRRETIIYPFRMEKICKFPKSVIL